MFSARCPKDITCIISLNPHYVSTKEAPPTSSPLNRKGNRSTNNPTKQHLTASRTSVPTSYFIAALKTCTRFPIFKARNREVGGNVEQMSRSQSGSAGSWASSFNPVAEARTRLPGPPPALRAPPEEPKQQLPHSQPGDHRCHRLPPPSLGKPSSRAGLGARHRAATRAWAEPVSPAAPPRQQPSPEPLHGSSSS